MSDQIQHLEDDNKLEKWYVDFIYTWSIEEWFFTKPSTKGHGGYRHRRSQNIDRQLGSLGMLEFGVIIFMIRLCMINPSSCAIIEWEKFTFQDYLKSSWVWPIFWAKKKCTQIVGFVSNLVHYCSQMLTYGIFANATNE